jgi:hypothetical protein
MGEVRQPMIEVPRDMTLAASGGQRRIVHFISDTEGLHRCGKGFSAQLMVP